MHESETAKPRPAAGPSSGNLSTTSKTPQTEREKLRETSHKVVEDVREFGRTAVGAAGEVVSDARDKGGRYVEEGQQKLSEYEDALIDYVRSRPMKSLLIAIGSGFLLGMFTRK